MFLREGSVLLTCHHVFRHKQVSHSIWPVLPLYIFILLRSSVVFSLQIELFCALCALFKWLTAYCRALEMPQMMNREKFSSCWQLFSPGQSSLCELLRDEDVCRESFEVCLMVQMMIWLMVLKSRFISHNQACKVTLSLSNQITALWACLVKLVVIHHNFIWWLWIDILCFRYSLFINYFAGNFSYFAFLIPKV